MELINNNDCLSYIFSFISYSYNSTCLSSSLFYKLIKGVHLNADCNLANHLSILTKLYPDKRWN